MLKAIEGIYHNGKIQLAEIPENILSRTKVIVTFLEMPETIITSDPPYTDLDYLLVDIWTEEEEAEFITNTKQLHEIDRNLWQ